MGFIHGYFYLQIGIVQEDCMAVVVDSIGEVREFFEEEGVDVDGLGPDELEEASEVFPLPDGKYLIVEG